MPIASAIVDTVGLSIRPRPLPPAIDDLIITSRRNIRVGMRVTGAALGVGSLVGGTMMSDRTREDWKPMLIGGAIAGAVLGAGSFVVRDSTARVLEVNLPNLPEALNRADGYDRSVGVLEHQEKFHLVDLSRLYDIDRLSTTEAASFRVGDGQVPFSGLVSKDGDLYSPLATNSTRGYRNQGTVAPRLDLASLAGKSAEEIDAALVGRRVGHDQNHAPLILGPRMGSSNGYANEDEMFAATFGATGDEAIGVRIGDRIHAFRAVGPKRQYTELRGTEIEPYSNLTAASRKSTWQASSQAGEGFSFIKRNQPYTIDEPIGQYVYMRGVGGTPSRWMSSHATLADAGSAIRRAAWRDWESQGKIDTPHYGIIEGATGRSNARFHVYSRSGAQTGEWEPELGRARGMSWTDEETRTQDYHFANETVREHQRRSLMYLRNDSGYDSLIKDTSWYTTRTERIPRNTP